VIVLGTPKRVIQEKTKAPAHADMVFSERRIASIHLIVRSMIVKMKTQQAGVAVDLALLAVLAGSRPVGDVIGEPAPDKSRRHKTPRGELTRV
jgi:hypothetical protein